MLSGEKAIWWPKHQWLLVADLHLGKANHFRKSGIPVPRQTNDKNLDRLIFLIQHHCPHKVVFLGDLFHSRYNSEWEAVGQVISAFPETAFELVAGNHDILEEHQYRRHHITIHKKNLLVEPFLLSHEPLETAFKGYNLAGHIHPAVRLAGSGRQHLRLPCFYFGKRSGILPAFGEFTGTYTLKPVRGDQVFVVVEGRVVAV